MEKAVSENISRTYETGPYFRYFGGSTALIALRDSYAFSTPTTANGKASTLKSLGISLINSTPEKKAREKGQLALPTNFWQYGCDE
ncbi:MAG: hypothetical protein AAF171_28340 [Cyanobacteria bacterium P01_A01_bin.116]